MFGVIRNIIELNKSQKGIEDQNLKRQVAVGVLLLEAAHIDNECSKEEMEQIIVTIKDKFALPDNCVDDLLRIANADRGESVDLWEFSRIINNTFTPEEKREVMEDVWRIILVDGKLDKLEDYFAHRLANLLHLRPDQMIDAKLKAREQLTQLK